MVRTKKTIQEDSKQHAKPLEAVAAVTTFEDFYWMVVARVIIKI
jgi:hypothetical protein